MNIKLLNSTIIFEGKEYLVRSYNHYLDLYEVSPVGRNVRFYLPIHG